MAEVLFGSPSLRITITTALQRLPFHATRAQRLQYIAEIRKRLELDYLLRGNHRQMAIGAEQFRNIPHWKLAMYRAPGAASPIHMPVETDHSGGLEIEAPPTEEMELYLDKAVEEYRVLNESKETLADNVNALTEEERAQLPLLLERLQNMRTEGKKK